MERGGPIILKKKSGNEKRQMRKRSQMSECKIGAWNVRGVNGKMNELIEEMEKYKLDVLYLSETKGKSLK